MDNAQTDLDRLASLEGELGLEGMEKVAINSSHLILMEALLDRIKALEAMVTPIE